ncbi:poly(rC)-binding 3-like isoform X1 [Brachionus plicatilis]|uniref:Poly(RC)-binding 3-like isoform X1 n=1 Tax=Brachionus plicatilis TaxID=10195 RepID=A0A3M7SU10_BRAPC|nr:poly(rC)-binding 3-like isoform X1 [Brachionus plicatilis]
MNDKTEANGTNGTNGKQENFVTIRLLMQGKEVGSIIGKKGDNIKSIREQSGARITISDGSTPERIVTINSPVENANKAFSLICKKFEDDSRQTCTTGTMPPITLRLIVPASQCGSIIGKSGSKIKEIREKTGASIQVASEMLPGSTERAVTLSGKHDSIIECFKYVAEILIESPAKGDTLSYKPRSSANTQPITAPIVFAHGQAYQIQGQYAIPIPASEVAKLIQIGAISQVPAPAPPPLAAYFYRYDETTVLHNQTPQPVTVNPTVAVPSTGNSTVSSTARSVVQTHEMTIPNDLIGCIIGRGGQKISEIRLVSGANIKIADLEDGNPDRHVSISGTPDQIQLAQFLINASTNAYAASLYANSSIVLTSGSTTPTSSTSSPVSQNSIDVIVPNSTNPNDIDSNNLFKANLVLQSMVQPVLVSYPEQINQASMQYQHHFISKNLNRDLKRQQLHFKPY